MKPFSQSSTISIFFLLLRIDTHVKVSFKTMGLKQWREERGEMVKGWGKLHRRTNRKLCRASLFGEKKSHVKEYTSKYLNLKLLNDLMNHFKKKATLITCLFRMFAVSKAKQMVCF